MATNALELAQQLVVLDINDAAIVVLILAAVLSFLMLRIIAFVGAAFTILMRGVINVAVPIILIALLLFLLSLVAGF